MNIDQYIYLLANPQKITGEDLSQLDHIVQQYPFFQCARALQLKGLKNQDSFRYNDALKLAAAHTTDRDILFEYITSDKFIQNEISQSILQQDPVIMELPVVAEDISEEIKEEKDLEWKVEIKKADAILNPNLFQRKVNSISESLASTQNKETEEEPKAADILEPDKPLEFTQKDTHSFSEWLKLTKAKPIDRKIDQPEDDADSIVQEEKDRKTELIDKFIQERPKITPSSLDIRKSLAPNSKSNLIASKDITAPTMQSTDSLMTETLARVYLQQKNYKKAIQAYKILILKNPEKSGFFADQIRAIEKTINTEEQ